MRPFHALCHAPCPFDPAQRCALTDGHTGLHAVTLTWGVDRDADTIQMPPIRDTARRRPPPPTVRELTDRAELLEAMSRELQRELRALQSDDGDDQGDDL